MIKVIEGNLLEATEDIIAHQVNCQGAMGSGVALQVKRKYPEAYNSYKSFIKVADNKKHLLGECQTVNCNGKIIANLFGQLTCGWLPKCYTNYDALELSLMKLKSYAKKQKLSVALPFKIGSVRGGADWGTVYNIINRVFDDYEVTLYKL